MNAAPEHPGVLLAHTLELLAMSQATLARRMGLSAKHINQVCQGEAGISARSAVAIEEATGVDAELWMRLQVRYDLATARTARTDELAAEHAARAAGSAAASDALRCALGGTS